MRTLLCDVSLGNYVQAARDLKLDILAVQEVYRAGQDQIDFEEDDLMGWKFIYHGQKKRGQTGIGFILSPNAEVVDSHPH